MRVDYFADLSVPSVPGTPSTTGDGGKAITAGLSPVSPVSPEANGDAEKRPEDARRWVPGWPFTCGCGARTGWFTGGEPRCPNCEFDRTTKKNEEKPQ